MGVLTLSPADTFYLLGCSPQKLHTYRNCQAETSYKSISSGPQKDLHTLSHSAPRLLLRRWRAGIIIIKWQLSSAVVKYLCYESAMILSSKPNRTITHLVKSKLRKVTTR